MRQINQIILHHSLTADNQTVSWNAIRHYHTIDRGWKDIGYHYGIELINDRYEILVGRHLTVTGAHTKGHNLDSIGICFVGNFDITEPPLEQWIQGVALVRSLLEVFRLTPDDVYGHRVFADKSCPGNLFNMDKFRNLLRV